MDIVWNVPNSLQCQPISDQVLIILCTRRICEHFPEFVWIPQRQSWIQCNNYQLQYRWQYNAWCHDRNVYSDMFYIEKESLIYISNISVINIEVPNGVFLHATSKSNVSITQSTYIKNDFLMHYKVTKESILTLKHSLLINNNQSVSMNSPGFIYSNYSQLYIYSSSFVHNDGFMFSLQSGITLETCNITSTYNHNIMNITLSNMTMKRSHFHNNVGEIHIGSPMMSKGSPGTHGPPKYPEYDDSYTFLRMLLCKFVNSKNLRIVVEGVQHVFLQSSIFRSTSKYPTLYIIAAPDVRIAHTTFSSYHLNLNADKMTLYCYYFNLTQGSEIIVGSNTGVRGSIKDLDNFITFGIVDKIDTPYAAGKTTKTSRIFQKTSI